MMHRFPVLVFGIFRVIPQHRTMTAVSFFAFSNAFSGGDEWRSIHDLSAHVRFHSQKQQTSYDVAEDGLVDCFSFWKFSRYPSISYDDCSGIFCLSNAFSGGDEWAIHDLAAHVRFHN